MYLILRVLFSNFYIKTISFSQKLSIMSEFPKKLKGAGRSKGTRNYNLDEIADLLDLVEESLPIGAMEWESLAGKYKRTNFERPYLSLRAKFHNLANKKEPTGNPLCSSEVQKAKRIHSLLLHKSQGFTGEEEANPNLAFSDQEPDVTDTDAPPEDELEAEGVHDEVQLVSPQPIERSQPPTQRRKAADDSNLNVAPRRRKNVSVSSENDPFKDIVAAQMQNRSVEAAAARQSMHESMQMMMAAQQQRFEMQMQQQQVQVQQQQQNTDRQMQMMMLALSGRGNGEPAALAATTVTAEAAAAVAAQAAQAAEEDE